LNKSNTTAINFDELEKQFKDTVDVDLIYSCPIGKNSECPECRLALCPGCCSSVMNVVGRKRGHDSTVNNPRECCHDLRSLLPIDHVWWATAEFQQDDRAKPYPRGCFGCLKKFNAGNKK